jgi:hypothetical protein
MAAVSLQRRKTALGAALRRIARHKGGAVAIFAVARKLAQLIYRMLRYGQDYVDIGEKAYEAQFEARRLASLKEAARASDSHWSRSRYQVGKFQVSSASSLAKYPPHETVASRSPHDCDIRRNSA